MEIFNEFNYNPNLSLALGFFDGVHSAHQKVINTAVEFAKKNSLKSAVVTFSNSPASYFLGIETKTILSLQNKINLIEKLGVDYLYIFKFDKFWANVSANDYVENYLIKNFKSKSIVTGFNHNFGLNKTGNSKLLKELSSKFEYNYFEIQPQKINGELISSTAIRGALLAGNTETANLMLGQDFSIEGEVVHGEQIGRTIGFKTANLDYPKNITDIKNGVYGVFVEFDGQKFKGILNCGVRPTVSNMAKKTLEVNIFDFNKNIYGKKIKVLFQKLLRNEKKFASVVELKEQIKQDVEYWRNA